MSREAFLERLYAKLAPPAAAALPVEVTEATDEEGGLTSYLEVRLGAERFAIPVRVIDEVIVEPAVTPVPRVRSEVKGVFMQRGALVPLVELARLVGVPDTGEEGSAKARVVITSRSEDVQALIVSEVLGIIDVPEAEWQELPPESWRYVHRACRPAGNLVGRLDIEELLAIGSDAILEAESKGP